MVTDGGLFDRHDTSHPIASIFGDVGKLDEAVDSLPEIEIWGINAYRGISCQTWINRCWMHRFAIPLDKLAQGPWLIAIQAAKEISFSYFSWSPNESLLSQMFMILGWMLGWMRHVFHEALATFSGNMRMRQASQCFLESWLHFLISISRLPKCLLALFDSKQEVLVWGNKIKHQPQVFLDAVQPSRNPGEYGADAFNAKIQGEDQESQAKATTALTEPWQWEHACKLLQVCSRKTGKIASNNWYTTFSLTV